MGIQRQVWSTQASFKCLFKDEHKATDTDDSKLCLFESTPYNIVERLVKKNTASDVIDM